MAPLPGSPGSATRGVRALILSLLLALAAVLPATGTALAQGTPAIIPILASSELAAGPNRFLFSLTDPQGAPLAAPDVSVRLRFYDDDVDPEAVVFEADARFLWAIEGVRGLYAADVDFPDAGRWGTRFDATFPDGRQETVRADYDVRETTSTPAIGAPAPPVDSPTAADVGGDLSAISSDPEPEPRFYERSIADAVEAGQPAIIAFVTPAFCQSGTCGPTIETVKAVASRHPEVNVVQVEPYVMQVAGRRAPAAPLRGGLAPAGPLDGSLGPRHGALRRGRRRRRARARQVRGCHHRRGAGDRAGSPVEPGPDGPPHRSPCPAAPGPRAALPAIGRRRRPAAVREGR